MRLAGYFEESKLKTKKELLAALAAAPIVCADIEGGSCLEDIPAMRERLTSQGWKDEGNKFTLGSGYVLYPKLNRHREGKFKTSSTKYTFKWDGKDSAGDIPHLAVDGDALSLTMFNGAIIRYSVKVDA